MEFLLITKHILTVVLAEVSLFSFQFIFFQKLENLLHL